MESQIFTDSGLEHTVNFSSSSVSSTGALSASAVTASASVSGEVGNVPGSSVANAAERSTTVRIAGVTGYRIHIRISHNINSVQYYDTCAV